MTPDWDVWFKSRPRTLSEHEEYTATLLYALQRVRESAPFAWGLTGGTALQSFFPEPKRRYSSDIEIITRATRNDVQAWMRAQAWNPEGVGVAPITKARLTPDGTLFVIHDYPADGYEAASPAPADFRHYPIRNHPPPETLSIPLLDYDFLVATKLFEVRKPGRGGERFKDAHDLGLALPLANLSRFEEKLGHYLRIRGEGAGVQDIIRQAGVWIRHYKGAGRRAFEAWRRRYVTNPSLFDAATELDEALRLLERAHGGPIKTMPHEVRRFLLADLTPKNLAPVAEQLGYPGSLSKEFETMADFVASAAFPKLGGRQPTKPEDLLAELRELCSL